MNRHFKLTLFILVPLLFFFNATNVMAQEGKKVTINMKNASLKEVFNAIEKQTTYRFSYRNVVVDSKENITISKTNATVSSILDEVLAGIGLSYSIVSEKSIVISDKSPVPENTGRGNPRKLSGSVKDTNGESVVGANVKEIGTNNGIITDIDGRFTLNVSNDAILQVSYIGYVTQEIQINNQTSLEILLKEDALGLEEIVVVGYGTQRKSDVTGAISSVGKSTLKEVPSINISQSMQGRVAGVSIQQTATRPGADSQIRIRGTRSLTASNDPLIVVDDIPFAGKLNDIASEDIKSVNILKDASSTAIYGSRGANGVILITTDRANTYTKPQVSYNGYTGISTVAKKYEMLNAEEFIELRTLSGYQAGSPYLPQEQQYFTTGKSFDWQDEMYKTASVNNHDLTFRAGSEAVQGSLGLNYYDETSVLPGQDFSRFSLRGAVDLKINNWLKVGYNTQNAFSLTNGEGVSTVALYSMLAFSPLVNPYDADGKPVVKPLSPRDDAYSPLLLKDKSLWEEERKRFNTVNALYGEIQFTPDLKYRINLGLNYYHDQYGEYYSSASSFKSGSTSSANLSTITAYNYTIENLLYYDKTLAGKHKIGATLMYSLEDNYFEYITAEGLDLAADYMKYHNLGMANDGVTFDGNLQSYQRRTLLSYMGRLNYGYDGKYMATFTLRSDGASVLALGKKWHTYPALSLAWNVNRESFLSNVEALDLLKIRLGYGQTSNQSVTPYATMGSLGQTRYNFGNDLVYGYNTSTLSNANLGWEYTNSYNMGIDFNLWSRLSGTLDLYLQKTNDLLVSQRLPYSSGVSNSIMVNVGKTRNKGMELTLHSDNIVSRTKGALAWKTDFNFYLNRNELVSLSSGITEDVSNGWFVGHPIDVIYDYKNWVSGKKTKPLKPLNSVSNPATSSWKTTTTTDSFHRPTVTSSARLSRTLKWV